MRTSQTTTAIFKAFIAAQSTIGTAAKNKVNPHLKNKYADLDSVWSAVSPALQANKLGVIQTPIPSEDGKLHLETMIIHESGEFIAETLVMPLSKQDPQGYGSALTYARRYHLSAMMGVVQDDDDAQSAIKSSAAAAAELIYACQSVEELQRVYGEHYKQHANDPAMLRTITAAKDKRKAELMPQNFNPAKIAKPEPQPEPTPVNNDPAEPETIENF